MVGFDRLCLPWRFHKQEVKLNHALVDLSTLVGSPLFRVVDVCVGSLSSFRGLHDLDII